MSTYYHGSNNTFTTFEPQYFGTGEGSNMLGNGIYLTNSLDKAKQYGNIVYTVNLKNNKMIDYDKVKYLDDFMDTVDAILSKNNKTMKLDLPFEEKEKLMVDPKLYYARKKGFDGVIYGKETIIVFDVKNIKSIKKIVYSKNTLDKSPIVFYDSLINHRTAKKT